ncbi:thiamine pyrophosphate-dependent dehydrogenase E1 component subunit alpha [Prauserella shujinwangii]|nr:thiamine pyrophosphate-dependent dehydrogenase E1 component subunit alpha [Prauserella shujinwangii]
MARIRHFETAASRLLASGELPGFLHLSIGQEAVAAGVCRALTDDDYLTTTHRGHGHCIAKGARIDLMLAELFGRAPGYCGGRSGSMHLADPGLGILGANAIVAAGVPIAVGGGLAAATRGRGQVAVAFFGDGAVAEGVVHESLNLAALWRLPVLFVCEDNQYAEMTPTETHLNNRDITAYASAHQVPAETVDGNDALAVFSAAERMVRRARDGDGPSFLHCRTYRWHGHFEGDAQNYREAAEVEAWRGRDPLRVLRLRMADESVPTAIDAECEREIALAVEWARAQPSPDPGSVTAHVYQPDGASCGS